MAKYAQKALAMLTRKFGNSGPYIYKGQQIDMYALSVWLARYNRRTNQKIYPSQVTENHIKLFIKEARPLAGRKD